MRWSLLVLLGLLEAGCRGRVEPSAAPSTAPSATPRAGVSVAPSATTRAGAAASSAPAESSAVAAEPLAPEPVPSFPRGEIRGLDVSGFGAAVVAYPDVSDLRSVPLVVAFHGNFDRPEWQCETWAAATGRSALVLCPRGQARPDTPASDKRYTYDSYVGMKREFLAALSALRVLHGLPETQRLVLIGFSLGANMGASLVIEKAMPAFASVILIEGGTGPWGRRSIERFRERGGRAMWFGCGQVGCAQAALGLRSSIEKVGVAFGLVRTSIGHTYDGAIAQGLAEHWKEVVADVPALGPPEPGKDR